LRRPLLCGIATGKAAWKKYSLRCIWPASRAPYGGDHRALWGSKVSPSTISELNKKAYVHIEDWRNRPLQDGRYPYVYVDGIYVPQLG